MRVLHVIHGFLPQFRGGTELYLLGLARAQRELGHEVEIVAGTTHDASEAHAERYEFDGFPVTRIVLSGSYLEHWTRSFSPEATRLFAETLQRIRPDLVHVQHWYRLSRSLIETCHRLGIPAVCTLHDLWTTCPRIFRIRNESFCERPLGAASCTDCVPRFPFMDDEGTAAEIELFRADFRNEMNLARRIIVPSRAHGDLIVAATGLPEDRIVVLPHGSIVGLGAAENGGPPSRQRDPARRSGFGRRPPIRLGVWGHLFHMKGLHLVLEALRKLGRKARRFDLQVWGEVIEPRYKARLEELAEGLDVTWHGAYRPADLRRVELDCAVIPSLCSESFSFVLDEAFDLGLPAIVSDRGALAERIGRAGAAFAAEDAASLAAVLERLADEPGRLATWRRAIPDLEPMARHAGAVVALYNGVLSEAAPRGLVADAGLPWRRLEHQTRLVRRYEAVMFGQIGHIKREAGRGDHYEGEMRKLMREKEEWAAERGRLEGEFRELRRREGDETEIIAVLAAEIENFRRSLVAYLSPDSNFEPHRPESADLPEHVPGLGPVAVLVEEDHKLMRDYGRELAKRRKKRGEALEEARREDLDKDALIALLGGELRAFRELVADLDGAAKRLRPAAPAVPDISVHVPELGPAALVVAEDQKAMSAFVAALAARSRSLAAGDEERAALAGRLRETEREIERLHELAGHAEGLAGRLEEELELHRAAEVELAETRERLAGVESEIDALRPLRARLKGQEALIDALALLIEEMRRGIVAIWDPKVRHGERLVADGRRVEAHVPGFGDIATIEQVNLRMLKDLHAEVARLRAEAAPRPAQPSSEPPGA